MYNEWKQWDASVHDHWEQVKRRLSGEKIKAAKVAVDPETGTAVILGSRGTPYLVDLSSCSCIDNSIRRVPCKHMYRLALELDLLEPWPVTDPPEVLQDTVDQEISRFTEAYLQGHVTPEKYVKILEALTNG